LSLLWHSQLLPYDACAQLQPPDTQTRKYPFHQSAAPWFQAS
jgi:hypothetical protein